MKKLLFALAILFSFSAQAQAPLYGMLDVSYNGSDRMLVKLPPVYNNPLWADSTFPVIFNFPGNGETKQSGDVTILFNTGYPKRVKDGKELYPLNSQGQPIYYISINPQPYAPGSLSLAGTQSQIWNYVVANYRVDTSKYASGPFVGKYRRVLYAGLSQGAADALNQFVSPYNEYIYRNQRIGKFMIASSPYLQSLDSIQRVANRRLIAYAGEYDGNPQDPANRTYIAATTDLVGLFNAQTANSANLTIIAGQGHNNVVWDSAWSTRNTPAKNMYRLLIDDYGDAPVENATPIALAGLDVTVQQGVGATVNGQASYDPDGSIASYAWTKISGPSQFTIQSPTTVGTFISNLVIGTYVFRLTVTDNLGASASDDITVTVQTSPNTPPTANAGPDQTITLPTNSTQLNAGLSSDADGYIQQYAWTKISGGSFVIDNAVAYNPIISGLVAGEYIFEVMAQDNVGAQHRDQVKITVATSGGIVKIPLDARRFSQGTNFHRTLETLVDGDITKVVNVGDGRILKQFDTWYEFPSEWNVSVSKIRGFDPPGGWFGEVVTIYGIVEGSWTKQLLGTFTGEFNPPNGGWDEINFAPKNLKYLIINTYSVGADHWPNELEVYGTYNNVPLVPISTIPKKNYENYFGANIYVWNTVQDQMFPFNGTAPYAPSWDLQKDMQNYRVYMNWEMLEMEQGQYKYNPSYTGSWNVDTALWQMSRGGRYPVLTVKAAPAWLQTEFPAGEQNGEVTPTRWANPVGSNFSNPLAYIDVAKLWFQIARRYGRNTSLVGVTVGAGNQPRAGLNFLEVLEIDNERDKWWFGRKGNQTGREYGAMLSAIYDGHGGTMGAYVGIKAADPTMKIAIAGTAQEYTDWMKGAFLWWKENRPDVPWPFIDNYHNYPMRFGQYANTPAQRAYAPDLNDENSNYMAKNMDDHNFVRTYITPNNGLWLSETGIDIDETSPMKATIRGNRSVLQTQGDWTYRIALEASRKRLDRVFFYEWMDNMPGSPGLFVSTGLVDGINLKKRPAYNYLQQSTYLLRGFQHDTTLKVTISGHLVYLDKYTKPGSDSVKWVGLVPTDSVASVTYNYALSNSSRFVRHYQHKDDQDYAYATYITPTAGIASIELSQTPVIWQEVTSTPAFTTPLAGAGADQNLTLPLTFNFNGNNRVGDGSTLPVLSGTGSDAAGPVSFQWVQTSGPFDAKIERPYHNVSNLYNLHQGTYTFQLQVTNIYGRMTTDDITINVANAPGNAAPIANVGQDTSFRMPVNSILLNGGASTDPDGTIIAYKWDKLSGPTWGLQASDKNVTNLIFYMQPGTFIFRLTVTDDKGASSSAIKRVVVLPAQDNGQNNLPVANAGPNINITLPVNTVQLNGIGQDAEGGVSYQWLKVSGPSTFNISNATIANPTVSNLVAGSYVFRLTVTDNQNAQSIDDMTITVATGSVNIGRVEYATIEYFDGTCVQSVDNATIKKNSKGQLTEVKLPSGTLVPLGDVRRILRSRILNQ